MSGPRWSPAPACPGPAARRPGTRSARSVQPRRERSETAVRRWTPAPLPMLPRPAPASGLAGMMVRAGPGVNQSLGCRGASSVAERPELRGRQLDDRHVAVAAHDSISSADGPASVPEYLRSALRQTSTRRPSSAAGEAGDDGHQLGRDPPAWGRACCSPADSVRRRSSTRPYAVRATAGVRATSGRRARAPAG